MPERSQTYPFQPFHAGAVRGHPSHRSVDDDRLVHIEGDDLSLVRWNHRPTLLRAALRCNASAGGRIGNLAGTSLRSLSKPSWEVGAPCSAWPYRAKGANATSSALLIPTNLYPTHPLRQICRPCGSPRGMPRAQRREKPCGARGDVEIERNGEDSSPIDVRQAQFRGTGGNDSS
jgi:hypothetical protein